MMNQYFKAKYFTPNVIIGLVISLVATYCLFPPYLDMGIMPVNVDGPSWMTLDPSWISTLNYVKIKDLNWGNDFAFTLGPLSYLANRIGWGQSKFDFLLFDLFCSLNFFLIFLISYTKSNNKLLTGFLILALAALLVTPFWALYSFVLLSFLLFWIRYGLDNKSIVSYIFQIILVVLLFFIKFNTGLISFVLFAAAIFYKIIFKKEKPLYLLAFFLLPIIIIYIVSGFLNVNIPEYIKSALNIVSGYNEIMYSNRAFGDRQLFAIIIVLISLGILLHKIFKDGKKEIYKSLLILFIFSISIYVLFKQSFVRADEPHMKEFYYCSLLIIFCVYDFHLAQKNKYAIVLIGISAVISGYFVNKLDPYAFDFNGKISKKGYVEGFQSFTPISGLRLFPNNNQLPRNILNKIGNNSIDSYPWNTQILLENKLNFTPRPVFQSYTAYTPELEEKNFEYYSSDKAPKFVLYDFEAIDNRYPLFDESKLNLIFTKNYSCVDTLTIGTRPVLLLEKKANAKKIQLVKSAEYAILMDSPLIPKEGIYYQVFIYRNLLGDFMSVVDHGPDIALSIVTKSGNTRKYKTSNKLLETGLFLTQLINDTHGFKSVMNGENKEENQIRGYYFEPESRTYFKDKIRIVEYKITQ
jgi:hypothetical protein